MSASYYSIYGVTGQKIKIECPPDSETTLLFINRFRFSDKTTVDIYIHSDQTNSKKEIKEKLLTFGNDEKDTANINLMIKPKTILYFTFLGQDCGIRLLFTTKSSHPIQFLIPPMQSLTSNNISDFSKKIIVELEKVFHSDEPFLLMLLVFEKYFSAPFFIQREKEFPNLIQNILQTSIKRLSDDPFDNLFKYINFVSFKLSLGYQLTEASAIIFISMINNILSNDSSSNSINEIIYQCYDTPHFLIYQALFQYIKPNIINQSLLLPVTFFSNKDINYVAMIYNYVISKKAKIHYTYLNLFTMIASEDELRLIFNQNQLYDPDGSIVAKNDTIQNQFIDTKISTASFFEKKEVQTQTFNFKPKKINQAQDAKMTEEKSLTQYKPKLIFSKFSALHLPYIETSFDAVSNQSFSIIPKYNSLNEYTTQPSKEKNKSEIKSKLKQVPLAKQSKGSNKKKDDKKNQIKDIEQTKEIIPEATKKIAKSKRSRKVSRNPFLFLMFTFIIATSSILLLCQYFFI